MLVKLTFTRTAVLLCLSYPNYSIQQFSNSQQLAAAFKICIVNRILETLLSFQLTVVLTYLKGFIIHFTYLCRKAGVWIWIFAPNFHSTFGPSSVEYFPIYCEPFFAKVWKKAEPRVVWKLLVVRRILNTSFAPRLSNGFVKEEVVG